MNKTKKQSVISWLLLAVIAGTCIAAFHFYPAWQNHRGYLTGKQLNSLSILKESVTVPGLTRTYNLFFVADSHISLCDERDADLQEKADQRQQGFVDASGTLSSESFSLLAKASNTLQSDLFIMGGDIIDSAMYASIDYVKDALDLLKAPYLYELGNHDFEYDKEYFSETAYDQYLPRLNMLTGFSSQSCYALEYPDLIIFTVNDQNNQISADALEEFLNIRTLGKPVVLVSHVPFEPMTEDTSLLEQSIQSWGTSTNGNSRVLLGPDGCRQTDVTSKFIEQVLAPDSPVVLVLAGHVHFYHKDLLNNRIPQIITGPAFEKKALAISLEPE